MPIIRLDYTNARIYDTYVSSSSVNSNYSGSSSIDVSNSSSNTRESLIRFDFARIPNNVIINSAQLIFRQSTLVSGAAIDVYLPLTSWDDKTVTYSNKPDVGEKITTFTPSANENIDSIADITSAVQMWVDSGDNWGVVLKTNVTNNIAFYSSENSANSTRRPALVIDYTIPTEDKKQVEVFGPVTSASSSTLPKGSTREIDLPPGLQEDDTLMCIVSHDGSEGLVLPAEWNILKHVSTGDGATTHQVIAYKKHNGENNVSIGYNGSNSSIKLAVATYAFRNVRELVYSGGATTTGGNSIQPAETIYVERNSFIMPIMTIGAGGSAYRPDEVEGFQREVHISTGTYASDAALSVYQAYNYNKTVYTPTDLQFRSSSTGYTRHLSVISIVPITNEPPRISGVDEYLGGMSSPFVKSYTVTDPEGDKITVVEKINGETIRTVNSGGSLSVNLTSKWESLPYGKHIVTIEARDDYDSPPHKPTIRTWTFTKTLPSDADLLLAMEGLNNAGAIMEMYKSQLAAKVGAVGDRFEDMVNKVRPVAEGEIMVNANSNTRVRGLSFRPSVVVYTSNSENNVMGTTAVLSDVSKYALKNSSNSNTKVGMNKVQLNHNSGTITYDLSYFAFHKVIEDDGFHVYNPTNDNMLFSWIALG